MKIRKRKGTAMFDFKKMEADVSAALRSHIEKATPNERPALLTHLGGAVVRNLAYYTDSLSGDEFRSADNLSYGVGRGIGKAGTRPFIVFRRKDSVVLFQDYDPRRVIEYADQLNAWDDLRPAPPEIQ